MKKLLNLFVFVTVLYADAAIFKHAVLKHPKLPKKIYLYFDVHLPLSATKSQIHLVDRVIQHKNVTVLTECTSTTWSPMGKDVSSKRIRTPYNFPDQVVQSAMEKYKKSFNSAPGDWDLQFLTQLTTLGNQKNCTNFIFSDDNRINLNNHLNYVWFAGWIAPMAEVVGIEITALEKNLIQRSGGDQVKLAVFLENTQKYFEIYLHELQVIAQKKLNKEVEEKVENLKSYITQFKSIAQHIQQFAGPHSTLGQFRTKAKKHAHYLVKKFGASEKALHQLLLDILSEKFENFHRPCKLSYIFEPYNALDSAFLTTILQDQTSNPVVVYAGLLHGEFLQKRLEEFGYTTTEDSSIRVSQHGKIVEYANMPDYLVSIGVEKNFSEQDIARIEKEFLGPLEQAFLAPLKNR